MAYRAELTARALRDLRAIYTFIQAETSGAAAHWFVGLEGAVFSLELALQRGAKFRKPRVSISSSMATNLTRTESFIRFTTQKSESAF